MSLLSQIKSFIGGSAPPPGVELQGIATDQLQKSHAAGLRLQSLQQALAAEGRSVVELVMNGNAFAKWQMYPWQGGILDQRSNSQYFYHSHEGYKGEHGHFHTFYYHQRKLVHLVAIGMDARGRINRLYTFNRWSPGDHYFPADRLKGFLPRFRIGTGADLDPRLHTVVAATLRLFRAEIEHLFDERDATFAQYRAEHDGASPFEDRDLEITSQLPVDIAVQMGRLEAELARRGSAPAPADAIAPAGAPAAPQEVQPAPESPAAAEPLSVRTTAQLKHAYEAGLAARAIADALRAQGRDVVQAVMNKKDFEHWAMYPWDGGVIDKKTRSQYFYHSHPQSPEHGHFHVFYSHRNQLAHLAAIAMDNHGEPVSLFTVNRWVTDDFYLPAAKLKTYISQFRIGNKAFDEEVNAYVQHILHLYQAEIGALMHQRDAVFDAYRAEHDGRSPFEDRDLDVTSSMPIRVEEQIAALEAELRSRGEL